MDNYQSNLTPEQKARKTIDRMLELSGWALQDNDTADFSASLWTETIHKQWRSTRQARKTAVKLFDF